MAVVFTSAQANATTNRSSSSAPAMQLPTSADSSRAMSQSFIRP
jgi:hypothetical protein